MTSKEIAERLSKWIKEANEEIECPVMIIVANVREEGEAIFASNCEIEDRAKLLTLANLSQAEDIGVLDKMEEMIVDHIKDRLREKTEKRPEENETIH